MNDTESNAKSKSLGLVVRDLKIIVNIQRCVGRELHGIVDISQFSHVSTGKLEFRTIILNTELKETPRNLAFASRILQKSIHFI
jgi:hypothetical protein